MTNFEEAAGPLPSGRDLAIVPECTDLSALRSLVKELLDERGIVVGDSPEEIGVQPDRVGYGDLVKTLIWAKASFGIIVTPDRWDHDTSRLLSSRLDCTVLLIGNLFERMWWYCLYHRGHLIDRHSSSPESYVQESGDPEFDDAANQLGYAQTLTKYMTYWRGHPELLSQYLAIDRDVAIRYLRQFTIAELDDLERDKERYCGLKAFQEDRYSLASQWVYCHLLERMGIGGISSDYWILVDEAVPDLAQPIYTPAVVGPLPEDLSKPPCAKKAVGNFFRGHEIECGADLS